jgi:predicted small lipoprotein YifL
MVFIRRDYCNNHACGTKNMRQAVRPGQFRTIISSALVLVFCVLAACGKTGALYLPDAGPAATASEPGAVAPAQPVKTP